MDRTPLLVTTIIVGFLTLMLVFLFPIIKHKKPPLANFLHDLLVYIAAFAIFYYANYGFYSEGKYPESIYFLFTILISGSAILFALDRILKPISKTVLIKDTQLYTTPFHRGNILHDLILFTDKGKYHKIITLTPGANNIEFESLAKTLSSKKDIPAELQISRIFKRVRDIKLPLELTATFATSIARRRTWLLQPRTISDIKSFGKSLLIMSLLYIIMAIWIGDADLLKIVLPLMLIVIVPAGGYLIIRDYLTGKWIRK